MGWLHNKAEAVFDRLTTCKDCGHNAPMGVDGCTCTTSTCVCST